MLGVSFFFPFLSKKSPKGNILYKKRNILSFILKNSEKKIHKLFFQESIATTIIITTDYSFEETGVGRFSLFRENRQFQF
jgi:hypothetical protein